MRLATPLFLLLLGTAALPVAAQAVGGLVQYDPSKEQVLTATVQELKEINLGTPALEILFTREGKVHCAVVGNAAFLKKYGFTFAKGDVVELTGVVHGPVDDGIFVSLRLVKKGDKTLVVKDQDGEPLWLPKL